MNHKRGKPKNARSGCLLCKPNKMNGGSKDKLGHYGFGKLRRLHAAMKDVKDSGFSEEKPKEEHSVA